MIFRDRLHPLEAYDDDKLYHKYMFPRVKMIQLSDLISDDLNQSNNNNAVPPVPAEC